MHVRWRFLLVLACAWGLLGTPPDARADEMPGPVRVLILGDSVTQGSSGDWTWRYRLWEHLASVGVDVDFVGPRDDVYVLGSDNQWSQDYLDPVFDKDHAARWGMTLSFQDVPIGDLVRAYRPDIVVEMLGINDLAWLGVLPEDLDGTLRTFIHDARAENPQVKMVLSTVPQTWRQGVEEYNTLMSGSVAELDSDLSPLEVAEVDDGFHRREHTWDPAHPNASGEFMLAAAVQDALAHLGVGRPFARPLPEVPLGPRRASSLEGRAGNALISLSWRGAGGATDQIIEGRDRTTGGPWQEWDKVGDTGRWSASARNGHRYEFRLRPVKGYWAAEPDVRSNRVALLPRPDAPARLTGSGSSFGRANLRWSGRAAAEAYQVRYRRVGTSRWHVLPRRTTRSVTVTGLRGRQRYEAGVRTWSGGFPSVYRAGAPVWVPPPRAVIRVVVRSPRRDTVQVTASKRPEATSYRILTSRGHSCRRVPRSSSFRRTFSVRRPAAQLSTRARTLWVRVLAVRHGVAGGAVHGSTACVRVR